jgi:hypothetical protein
MTLFERTQQLCKDKNVNFAYLERVLGFGNGTIKKWTHVTPGIDKVKAVADYSNIGIDDLIGREIMPVTIIAGQAKHPVM